MWAEARKHEKKLRGLMVDYRRRAERRREFYDRIRSDPAAFLQIHGSQLKIHIDANLSSAADSSLMPWMGDNSNMIDRFDVRAHLDRLDDVTNTSDDTANNPEEEALERQINYERYRNLVQNEFLGLNETKFLNQIYHEERFGAPKDYPQNKSNQKKKLAENKAAIAFDYEEVDYSSQTVQSKNNEESDSEESSDDDYDFDTTVNIDQLDNEAGHRINSIAIKFGMKNDDFVKYLDEDKTEAEKIRVQKEIENEKSMFTGRKSRRERRALKEQRLLILRAANVEESTKIAIKKPEIDNQSQSSSDSEISVDETKIEFITSFGGSSEDETPKESVEKKEKQEIVKRKKIKALINQKTEPIPVVYGPTLPGEDTIPPMTSTSFNKSNHSKQRTYRFNDNHQRSRSRSRSRSIDRYKRRTDSRYYPRRTRSRSRSPDVRRPSNRTFDRYRDRRRSQSRDRLRRRSKSRSRSRNRRFRRSRSRNRDNRRRSRSNSRSRRSSRRRSRSRDNSRSRRRRSRSRSRRRSWSRDKERKRDSDRRRDKSIPKRSRSKSPNKVIKNEENVSVSKNIDSLVVERPEKTEQLIPSMPTEAKLTEIFCSTDEFKSEIIDLQQNEMIKEEKPIRVPSPPIKSYYRHDLCDSEDSEEGESKDKNKREKDLSIEGNQKKSLSNVSNIKTGYKSSATITPHERLKKKRQALIDKQYKLDKKAELEKLEKQQQEREDREEELREFNSKIKYRRGFREPMSSRSSSRSRSHSRSVSRSSSGSDSSSSSY